MSENVELDSELNPILDENEQVEIRQKRSLLSRLGCSFLLIIWFAVLLTPCTLIYLASNGEIRFSHSDIPDSYDHPRLSIELVTEVKSRGLRVVNSSVVDNDLNDNLMCVQTNVRFLLWQTNEDNQDVSFCDCYERDNVDSEWIFTGSTPDVCLLDS
jgi:hypothetical protein